MEKQVENFRCLGSVVHAMAGSKEAVKARIVAAWKNCHGLTGYTRCLCCVINRCLLHVKERYKEEQ